MGLTAAGASRPEMSTVSKSYVVPIDKFASRLGEDAVGLFDASRLTYPPSCAEQAKQHVTVAVQPSDGHDVLWILSQCRKHKLPVTPFGSLTGIRGQAFPMSGGVALDFGRMKAMKDFDLESLTVTVLPGLTYAELAGNLAKRGFRVRVTPLRSQSATVGGFLAEGGLGVGSLKYGPASSDILHLSFVNPYVKVNLAYLSLAVYPEAAPYLMSELDPFIRGGSGKVTAYALGYNLKELFAGSEGTLGVMTQATFAVRPSKNPPAAKLYGYQAWPDALEACTGLLKTRNTPYYVGLFSAECLGELGVGVEAGKCYVLEALDEEDAEKRAHVEKQHQPLLAAKGAPAEQQAADRLWKAVQQGIGQPPDGGTLMLTEEVKVPLPQAPDAVNLAEKVCERHGVKPAFNLALISRFEAIFTVLRRSAKGDAEGLGVFEQFAGEIREALSGASAAPYGVGATAAALVEKVYPQQARLLKAIKRSLDPWGILNPGKLFG